MGGLSPFQTPETIRAGLKESILDMKYAVHVQRLRLLHCNDASNEERLLLTIS